MNYELWSEMQKEKEGKKRYREQQKAEYLDMLRAQGIDTSKINMNDIVFQDADEENADEGDSIQVIE